MHFKIVKRYYCDFCGKSGLSASHISRHEKACTLNPQRICRMCHMDMDGTIMNENGAQAEMETLLALLPDPKPYLQVDEYGTGYGSMENVVNAALPALREAAGGCPACMMAALRQKGIPIPCATEFIWNKEREQWWGRFNDWQHERDRLEMCCN